MLQTSARLLGLLASLQARRFWTGSELSERLEVTERTVRRDIERLRSLGYPVESAPGVAGGYQLGAGAVLPPLLLDDDEALAMSIALGTAASGTVSGVEEPALRALGKLERVLPAHLQRKMSALRASIVPLGPPGPVVDSRLLSLLAGACRDRQCVRFAYADGQARESQRSVEPQGLVHTGSRWYLVAWDRDKQDWRTFRVDRIAASTAALGERFAPRSPPEGGDLRAYVGQAVASAPYAVQASVVLHAPLEELARRIPPMAGQLERVDDGRCLLRTGAHSPAALAGWMGMIGVEFEVREPAELVVQLRELEERVRRAIERSTQRGRRRSKRSRAKGKRGARAL